HPDRPDEVAITPLGSRASGLGVGDTLALRAFTPPQAAAELRGEDIGPPQGPAVTVRIVGVELAPMPEEALPSGQDDGALHLTPAFGRRYGGRIGTVDLVLAKLRGGPTDVAEFKAAVQRATENNSLQFETEREIASKIRRSLHLQSVALRLFAAIATIACLLVLGQTLARHNRIEALDHPTLAALGMKRWQLWAAAMLGSAAMGLVGAALAAGVAILLSTLMPFGLARELDPSLGVSFDEPAVLLGALAVTVVVPLVTAVPSWWTTTRSWLQGGQRRAIERPSLAVRALSQVGAPVSALVGTRMATQAGAGPGTAPVRGATAAATLSLAALISAVVFGANLDRMLKTPRLYGFNWDVIVGDPFYEDLTDELVPPLLGNRSVGGLSSVAFSEVTIGDERTQALGFETLRGAVLPPILDGRPPQGTDEVVLGTKTLEAVGAGLGEMVTVRAGEQTRQARIVGRGVFPEQFGQTDPPALGEGALFTGEGLAQLVPDAPRNLFGRTVRRGCRTGDRHARPRGGDHRGFLHPRPAAQGCRRLRQGQQHAGGARGAARFGGAGHAHSRARDDGSAATPGAGHFEDARLHPRASADQRGMAGHGADPHGARRGRSSRLRGRTVVLATLRRRAGHCDRSRHADDRTVDDGAGCPRRRQLDRRASGRAAARVSPSAALRTE
ncbi:MAG: FtsX-like permease family protein, partial [Actinomycetota bacterium]|nr:FtsX-like permease family protein [Actinomycetota bacterium]